MNENKENLGMDETAKKFMVAIPEKDRYMFESGICEGPFPEKKR